MERDKHCTHARWSRLCVAEREIGKNCVKNNRSVHSRACSDMDVVVWVGSKGE